MIFNKIKYFFIQFICQNNTGLIHLQSSKDLKSNIEIVVDYLELNLRQELKKVTILDVREVSKREYDLMTGIDKELKKSKI